LQRDFVLPAIPIGYPGHWPLSGLLTSRFPQALGFTVVVVAQVLVVQERNVGGPELLSKPLLGCFHLEVGAFMYRMPLVLSTVVLAVASMTGCAGISKSTIGLPSIVSASPSTAIAGSSSINLTISGINFGGDATVLVNGSARATTSLNNSQLMSVLTSTDLS
jgi:hypothetical protein